MPPHPESEQGWQAISNLASELAQRRPPLASFVDVLDLEFDVRENEATSSPSLFAELNARRRSTLSRSSWLPNGFGDGGSLRPSLLHLLVAFMRYLGGRESSIWAQ